MRASSETTGRIERADAKACRAILREGSKSFFAASLLLPPRVRSSVAAFYAFCRVADDAIDRADDPARGLVSLRARVDAIEAGAPLDHAADRAVAVVLRRHGIPRAVIDAMLEGFAWDVSRRRYETLPDLRAYCVRVAGTVGVAMTLILGERREQVLRRAVDLGVAMQLTNVARDAGEDAREGRVYLPLEWLREAGIDPDELVRAARFTPELGGVVRRLLASAEPLYARADHGIRLLPRDSRLAIAAARRIYADIGRSILAAGYDTVSSRAHTGAARKAWLLGRSIPAAWSITEDPSSEPAIPEASDLIAAVGQMESR
jgi:phytoene synthase